MVLVVEKVHEAGLALLRARPGIDVIEAGPSNPSFLPALSVAAAIGIRIARLDASLLARTRRLRIVSKHGVGTDAIDIAWCTLHGVPVTVTPDANTVSVAEHTMTLMLAATKRLRSYDAAARTGRWSFRDTLEATELAGRTVLVAGFGRVGQRVAEICRAFGMDVVVFTRSADCAGFRVARSLDEGLAGADVVTLHLPRTDATTNLFDAARIARLKPGALLVNCARGGIVDEAALAVALREGRVGAAGLDVFAEEPLPAGHKLASFPNVVLTPHSAASTAEGARRMAVAMAENVLAGLDGILRPDVVVNPEVLVGARPASSPAGHSPEK